MKLHASGEDYLETILVLQKKRGMVRSVDVARHMEVSKPSVCHAVATLRDGGFLMMDEDHFLHLTDVGREVAEKIYERHCFFTEQLIAAGVDPETAEVDACRIEHVISNESFERLKEAAFRNQENEISVLSKEIGQAHRIKKTVFRWADSSCLITHLPSEPVLGLEGFFMCWSASAVPLLIQSSNYLHNFIQE